MRAPRSRSIPSRAATLAVVTISVTLSFSSRSRADYAAPPESPYAPEPDREPTLAESPTTELDAEAPARQPSTLRVQVGPAASLASFEPGLLTAIDLGRGAVGGRVQAMWLRSGAASGFSGYSGELWVDLGDRLALRPILGAGAAYLRGGAAFGEAAVGAASLRGSLDYELPLREADARLGITFVALLPAIASKREKPLLVGALTLGAGF